MNCIKKIEKRWPKSDMWYHTLISLFHMHPNSRLGSAMHTETNHLDVLHLRERVSDGITTTQNKSLISIFVLAAVGLRTNECFCPRSNGYPGMRGVQGPFVSVGDINREQRPFFGLGGWLQLGQKTQLFGSGWYHQSGLKGTTLVRVGRPKGSRRWDVRYLCVRQEVLVQFPHGT